MFDFPASPLTGDEYTSGGVTYVYTGTVWDLKGGGSLTDYVLKAGDQMTGALEVQSLPANGKIALLPGDATNNGRIEWTNPDGTRKAYLGYSGPTVLSINLDSATSLQIPGGDVIVPNGGVFVGDAWHGWVWDNTSNGEHLRSYQGKFEFRKTNGSVPGTLQLTIDQGNIINQGYIVTRGSGVYLDSDTPGNRAISWRNNAASTRWKMFNYWGQGDELRTNDFNDSGVDQGVVWSLYRVTGNAWLRGNVSVTRMTDRSLVNEPELAAFVEGEDEPERNPMRGVNVGRALLHALREIKALKAEIATLKGAP